MSPGSHSGTIKLAPYHYVKSLQLIGRVGTVDEIWMYCQISNISHTIYQNLNGSRHT